MKAIPVHELSDCIKCLFEVGVHHGGNNHAITNTLWFFCHDRELLNDSCICRYTHPCTHVYIYWLLQVKGWMLEYPPTVSLCCTIRTHSHENPTGGPGWTKESQGLSFLSQTTAVHNHPPRTGKPQNMWKPMLILIFFRTEYVQAASHPGRRTCEQLFKKRHNGSISPAEISDHCGKTKCLTHETCQRAAIQCSPEHLAHIMTKDILQCGFQLKAVVWLGLVTIRWFHSTGGVNSWSERHEKILTLLLERNPHPPQCYTCTPSLYMCMQTQYVWL